MAAYAALLSVKYIIEQLQHHPRPPISMDQNLVRSLIQNVDFLQQFLEDYSHIRDEEVDQLQSRIAYVAYEAEDVIESHIVDQIVVQSTRHFNQGIHKVSQDIDLMKKEVMEIKEKGAQDQKHIRSAVPVATSFGSPSFVKNTMVGFDDVLEEIMDKLTQRQSNRQIIPIVGMGGIGKTTLAKNVYENPLIVQNFDIRAWTTISQEYSVKEILFELLRSQRSEGRFDQMSEEELGEALHKILYSRRYLIIMDDMWNVEVWDKLKRYLPRDSYGSGIIITSRLSSLDSLIPGASSIKMNFLSENKSWDLFCNIVFGGDCCPLELEKIGKKIVENCRGLPLSIVVIGGLLAKSEQTQQYWEYIAENLNSVVNLEDNERCLNLLYMSYNYLPVHLRPCFLYMGVFNEDHKVHVSELIKLWVAEGFLKPISGKSLEEVAQGYLKALVDRNLILVDKWTHSGEMKLCKMHDLLREVCLREAEKDSFLYTTRLKGLNNFPPNINTQRRIAIHRRRFWEDEDEYYLPEIRDASQSMRLARSLICVSLKVLPFAKFRLSRVLKAYDMLAYNVTAYNIFDGQNHTIDPPFQLVNLRYLTFISNSSSSSFNMIPSSVYLLWNLQTLIVDHFITSNVDIWKMPLLRHVKLTVLYLFDPGQDDFVLGDLQTLSNIRNFKCSEEVVKRIPNIQKLKFSYNRNALSASHYCLNNLEHLHKLESLNCNFSSDLSWSDLVHNLTFPHSLKKLTLVGCCLLWEDMSTKIGSLPHLQVLKLGPKSFIGPEWETVEGEFLSLKFLKIETYKELECWTTEASHFPRLEQLFLRNLRSLQEIPSDLGNISTLKLIEIADCNKAAMVSAEDIKEEQAELENQDLQVRVLGTPYEP